MAMFAAREMVAVAVDLERMKVKQLADELAARGAPKSANRKRVLQLRLRALIISAVQEGAAVDDGRGAAVDDGSDNEERDKAS